MVVARLTKFYFKEGRREEGFTELDLILNKEARNAQGFRGYVSMFSCDQDNVVVTLTMWEDDESYVSSQAIFNFAVEKITPLLEKQPEPEHHRIDTVFFT